MYVKPKNIIFAWHLLVTERQQPSESITSYLLDLKLLSKVCECKQVTADA